MIEAAAAVTAEQQFPENRYATQMSEVKAVVLAFLQEKVEATTRGTCVFALDFISVSNLKQSSHTSFESPGAAGSLTTLLDCLRTFCVLPDVRLLTSQHMERWLQSPVVVEKARGLLSTLAASITPDIAEDDSIDRQVILNILKLR